MRPLAAIVLLASLTAHAQHIGSENRYATFGGAYAVVATGSGAALAFRGPDPATGRLALRTATVDRNGALESSSTIDVPDGEAFAPSLARAGDSLLLAFIHRDINLGDRVAAMPLDRHARPAGPIRFLGFAKSVDPPLLAAHGTTFSLWDPLWRYELDAAGAIVGKAPTDKPAQILTFDGGELRFGRQSEDLRRVCGFRGCGMAPPYYRVSWQLFGARVTAFDSREFRWYAQGRPAAAGTEAEHELIWSTASGIDGVSLRNGSIAAEIFIAGSVDYHTSPAVAFDGARHLIVFEDFGDVYGVLFDAATNLAHRFPVATSGLAEADVNVVTLSRGRFLVTYRSDDTLASRIVTTGDAPPEKRRSVR